MGGDGKVACVLPCRVSRDAEVVWGEGAGSHLTCRVCVWQDDLVGSKRQWKAEGDTLRARTAVIQAIAQSCEGKSRLCTLPLCQVDVGCVRLQVEAAPQRLSGSGRLSWLPLQPKTRSRNRVSPAGVLSSSPRPCKDASSACAAVKTPEDKIEEDVNNFSDSQCTPHQDEEPSPSPTVSVCASEPEDDENLSPMFNSPLVSPAALPLTPPTSPRSSSIDHTQKSLPSTPDTVATSPVSNKSLPRYNALFPPPPPEMPPDPVPAPPPLPRSFAYIDKRERLLSADLFVPGWRRAPDTKGPHYICAPPGEDAATPEPVGVFATPSHVRSLGVIDTAEKFFTTVRHCPLPSTPAQRPTSNKRHVMTAYTPSPNTTPFSLNSANSATSHISVASSVGSYSKTEHVSPQRVARKILRSGKKRRSLAASFARSLEETRTSTNFKSHESKSNIDLTSEQSPSFGSPLSAKSTMSETRMLVTPTSECDNEVEDKRPSLSPEQQHRSSFEINAHGSTWGGTRSLSPQLHGDSLALSDTEKSVLFKTCSPSVSPSASFVFPSAPSVSPSAPSVSPSTSPVSPGTPSLRTPLRSPPDAKSTPTKYSKQN